MPKGPNYTNKDIKFIKDNYETRGADWISDKLKRTKCAIISMANYLGLKYSKELYSKLHKDAFINTVDDEYKIFAKNFRKATTKYHAYILGLLWADGYINPTNLNIQITLEINDAKTVMDTIMNTGDWNVYKEKPQKPTHEPCLRFSKSNRIFYDFLVENDYLIKSGASSDKILNKIPKYLQPYWWQGYFDGDGHIGTKYKKLMFSSCFNQNWEFLTNLCKKLNIKTTIRRFTNKTGSGSECYLSSAYESMYKFFNFIYGNKMDVLCFKRKFNSFIFHFNPVNKRSNFFRSKEFVKLYKQLK